MKSYAKVNLLLKVIGLRQNYHLIEVINYKIDLYDDIYITESNELSITYTNFTIDKEKDLIYKMVSDLMNKYHFIKPLNFRITKNIPVGAGLGGTSSNLATILLYINDRFKLNLDNNELIQIALSYSTDMCYFLSSGTCLVKGIGEKVEKINIKLPKHIILVYPNISISTKYIYDNVESFSKPLSDIEKDYKELIQNDLESVVCRLYNLEKEVIEKLRNVLDCKVSMSGSGSSIIVYSESIKDYNLIKELFKDKGYLIKRVKVLEE